MLFAFNLNLVITCVCVHPPLKFFSGFGSTLLPQVILAGDDFASLFKELASGLGSSVRLTLSAWMLGRSFLFVGAFWVFGTPSVPSSCIRGCAVYHIITIN